MRVYKQPVPSARKQTNDAMRGKVMSFVCNYPASLLNNLSVSLDVLQRVQNKPVYSKAWFLTVLVLAAYGLLFVVAAILIRRYRHGRGHKYNGMYYNATQRLVTSAVSLHYTIAAPVNMRN